MTTGQFFALLVMVFIALILWSPGFSEFLAMPNAVTGIVAILAALVPSVLAIVQNDRSESARKEQSRIEGLTTRSNQITDEKYSVIAKILETFVDQFQQMRMANMKMLQGYKAGMTRQELEGLKTEIDLDFSSVSFAIIQMLSFRSDDLVEIWNVCRSWWTYMHDLRIELIQEIQRLMDVEPANRPEDLNLAHNWERHEEIIREFASACGLFLARLEEIRLYGLKDPDKR